MIPSGIYSPGSKLFRGSSLIFLALFVAAGVATSTHTRYEYVTVQGWSLFWYWVLYTVILLQISLLVLYISSRTRNIATRTMELLTVLAKGNFELLKQILWALKGTSREGYAKLKRDHQIELEKLKREYLAENRTMAYQLEEEIEKLQILHQDLSYKLAGAIRQNAEYKKDVMQLKRDSNEVARLKDRFNSTIRYVNGHTGENTLLKKELSDLRAKQQSAIVPEEITRMKQHHKEQMRLWHEEDAKRAKLLKSLDKGRTENKIRILELERELKDVKKDHVENEAGLTEKIAALEASTNCSDNEKTVLAKAHDEAITAKNAIETSSNAASKQVDDLKKKLAALTKQNAELQSHAAALKENHEKEIVRLNEEVRVLKSEMASSTLDGEIEALKLKVKTLQRQLRISKEEEAAKEEKNELLRCLVNNLEEDIEEYKARLGSGEGGSDGSEDGQVKTLLKTKNDLADENKRLEAAQKQSSQEVRKLASELKKAEEKISKLELDNSEMKKLPKSTTDKGVALEKTNANLLKQIEDLKKQSKTNQENYIKEKSVLEENMAKVKTKNAELVESKLAQEKTLKNTMATKDKEQKKLGKDVTKESLGLKKQLDAAAAATNSLQDENTSMKARLKDSEAEKAKQEEKIRVLCNTVEDMNAFSQKDRDTQKEIQAKLVEEVQAKKEEYERNMAAAEDEIRRVLDQNAKANQAYNQIIEDTLSMNKWKAEATEKMVMAGKEMAGMREQLQEKIKESEHLQRLLLEKEEEMKRMQHTTGFQQQVQPQLVTQNPSNAFPQQIPGLTILHGEEIEMLDIDRNYQDPGMIRGKAPEELYDRIINTLNDPDDSLNSLFNSSTSAPKEPLDTEMADHFLEPTMSLPQFHVTTAIIGLSTKPSADLDGLPDLTPIAEWNTRHSASDGLPTAEDIMNTPIYDPGDYHQQQQQQQQQPQSKFFPTTLSDILEGSDPVNGADINSDGLNTPSMPPSPNGPELPEELVNELYNVAAEMGDKRPGDSSGGSPELSFHDLDSDKDDDHEHPLTAPPRKILPARFSRRGSTISINDLVSDNPVFIPDDEVLIPNSPTKENSSHQENTKLASTKDFAGQGNLGAIQKAPKPKLSKKKPGSEHKPDTSAFIKPSDRPKLKPVARYNSTSAITSSVSVPSTPSFGSFSMPPPPRPNSTGGGAKMQDGTIRNGTPAASPIKFDPPANWAENTLHAQAKRSIFGGRASLSLLDEKPERTFTTDFGLPSFKDTKALFLQQKLEGDKKAKEEE